MEKFGNLLRVMHGDIGKGGYTSTLTVAHGAAVGHLRAAGDSFSELPKEDACVGQSGVGQSRRETAGELALGLGFRSALSFLCQGSLTLPSV